MPAAVTLSEAISYAFENTLLIAGRDNLALKTALGTFNSALFTLFNPVQAGDRKVRNWWETGEYTRLRLDPSLITPPSNTNDVRETAFYITQVMDAVRVSEIDGDITAVQAAGALSVYNTIWAQV